MPVVPPPTSKVAAVFAAYPTPARKRLLTVRRLILQLAQTNEVIGPLTEALKWGEPAYLTDATRAGSTLRLSWNARAPGQYTLCVNCRTTLIDTFRALFPEQTYEGNRAIVFDVRAPVPADVVRQCAELALTYHRRKRKRAQAPLTV